MMRLMAGLGVITVAAVVAAAPARAQVADARELVAGQVATGAPATAARPDIYYFVGEAGAKVTFALSSKAGTRLVLYTPTGEEMLTAGGDGAVSLEAVLPFSEVYTLAVIRRDAAQPYTLFMTATQPTLAEAFLANGVGYETRGVRMRKCWITPGVVTRTIFPDDPQIKPSEGTIGSDRASISIATRLDGGGLRPRYVFRYRIEDAEVVESTMYPDGREGREFRRSFTTDFFGLFGLDAQGSPAPVFIGYRCDP